MESGKQLPDELIQALHREKMRSPVHPMDRFFNVIDHFEWLSGYFRRVSRDKGEADIEQLKNDFPGFSHGQKIMASFFVYVFTKENLFKFDLIVAVAILDYDNLQVILDWGSDPYWP